MLRRGFLKRMAFAAMACGLLDLAPRTHSRWSAPENAPVATADGEDWLLMPFERNGHLGLMRLDGKPPTLSPRRSAR